MQGLKYKFDAPLDSVARTLAHRNIIQSKPFLKKTYLTWYLQIAHEFDGISQNEMVEIGSGGGFLKEILPNIITSDIQNIEGVDKCFPANELPFANSSLQGICMINVFHHIPDPAGFLNEASRVLKSGGAIIMIEPANTIWGRLVYRNFHHEDHDTRAGWELPEGKPLSMANSVLPWIVFIRDKELLQNRFPGLMIESITFHTSFLYLLSGGFTYRIRIPGFLFGALNLADKILCRISSQFAMFMTIKISKIP